MIARCQVAIERDGRCSAIITYPIKGFPWRRNPMKIYEFHIGPRCASELFTEVLGLRERFPSDCLTDDILWSDHTEAGSNAVTRDSEGISCHTIYIQSPNGYDTYYSMREGSEALQQSKLFATITELISPYETLQPLNNAEQGGGGNSAALRASP
jgi:hypothetical protein